MKCPNCKKRIKEKEGTLICPRCGELIMSAIQERKVDTADHSKDKAEKSERKKRSSAFWAATGAALKTIGKFFVDAFSFLFSTVGILLAVLLPFVLVGFFVALIVAVIMVPIVNFIRYYVFRIDIDRD